MSKHFPYQLASGLMVDKGGDGRAKFEDASSDGAVFLENPQLHEQSLLEKSESGNEGYSKEHYQAAN